VVPKERLVINFDSTITISRRNVMKKRLSSIIFSILCICLVPVPGFVCTTFVLNNNGQLIYGKNADWEHIPGYVVVNKRGVAKTSMYTPLEPDAKKISFFTSRT